MTRFQASIARPCAVTRSAFIVATLIALSGCVPVPKSEPERSEQSGPPVASASSSAPSAPSPSPSPTMRAADGDRLTVPTLSLRLTKGPLWHWTTLGNNITASYLSEGGYPVTVTMGDLGTTETDIAANGRAYVDATQYKDPKPSLGQIREVNGVQAWTATGSNADYDKHWVGGIHGGRQWMVAIEIPRRLPEGPEIRERIFASIVWTVQPSMKPSPTASTSAPALMLTADSLSVRLPAAPWDVSSRVASFDTGRGSRARVTVSEVTSARGSLDSYAKAFLEVAPKDLKARRLADRTLGGESVWVIQGANAKGETYWLGGFHGGRRWILQIQTPAGFVGAAKLRDDVIAGVQWR